MNVLRLRGVGFGAASSAVNAESASMISIGCTVSFSPL